MHTSSYFVFAILALLISGTNADLPSQPGQYLSLANQYLAPHNAARAALRLGPLVWDTRLERYAEWYADNRREDCNLKHSNGPYGENIFWGSGSGWSAAQAVAEWVSERKWYDYYSNSCADTGDCGHYTQIVWRDTKRVGCASVTCDDGDTFTTCNYDPPGNFVGERPY
ncbi:hypothetical protein K2173_015980 [Erythroxylum novogranatense]|uniref:SCP domain-containing protein n=1 Tax=Erythroxylum novogranatense TaxID=1862640 RepID=A0AAV8SFL2_9ROSI|nr:hypothetical protein K2173_015980 [Erythroxylum novogranatense]